MKTCYMSSSSRLYIKLKIREKKIDIFDGEDLLLDFWKKNAM